MSEQLKSNIFQMVEASKKEMLRKQVILESTLKDMLELLRTRQMETCMTGVDSASSEDRTRVIKFILEGGVLVSIFLTTPRKPQPPYDDMQEEEGYELKPVDRCIKCGKRMIAIDAGDNGVRYCRCSL